ncbi:hypothetical protein M0813_03279 [Anaeramoeba flamelloides]|uniref:Uncharacterized protein n=1 Tax=Anaeramoeba flamelloides TaxID=1746091 RepID=A0ABQ8XZM1_9EUKA|nr:hypothetical protein M0813_03279 [Anaeramoeba flamelloides]
MIQSPRETQSIQTIQSQAFNLSNNTKSCRYNSKNTSNSDTNSCIRSNSATANNKAFNLSNNTKSRRYNSNNTSNSDTNSCIKSGSSHSRNNLNYNNKINNTVPVLFSPHYKITYNSPKN